ncbi:MAG TPA: helix-turn-helix transcriptional regulator [Chloroflexia bacterium]|nr:helix-turn-helix transcriptional regulator [Chloroflexia bacterium]
MSIGNNISLMLKERNEKIRSFSRNIGISYTTAFDLYHANTSAISFELLDKLCRYFNVTPNELFPYNQPEQHFGLNDS